MLFQNYFFDFFFKEEKVLGWGGDLVQIVDALHLLVNMGKLSQAGRNMERLS